MLEIQTTTKTGHWLFKTSANCFRWKYEKRKITAMYAVVVVTFHYTLEGQPHHGTEGSQ